MKVIVTVKMVPESVEEMEETFATTSRNCIEHFKALQKENTFGEDDVELRYLIVNAPTIGKPETSVAEG